jgi:hypothetical protein
MPALNFQKRFAAEVEAGSKRQSIREKLRFRIGDTVHLFTGMRQRGCVRLGMGTVVDIASVRIVNSLGWDRLFLEGKQLSSQPARVFALADGFNGFEEMAKWFRDTHGLPFDGFLIRWEPVLLGDACREFYARREVQSDGKPSHSKAFGTGSDARSQASTGPAMAAGAARQ